MADNYEAVLPIKICKIAGVTAAMEPVDINTENINYFPIIQEMIEISGEIDENHIISIPFQSEIIYYYKCWCGNNNISLDHIPWRNIVKMFRLATFLNSEKFIRYFTFKMIPRVLNEVNVFKVRYLLSYSHSISYLECAYDDNDWDYNPFVNHSYEHDCILSNIPIEIMKSMFLILSIRKQLLLIEAITGNTSSSENPKIGRALWELYHYYGTSRSLEVIHEFDLSDRNDRLNNI